MTKYPKMIFPEPYLEDAEPIFTFDKLPAGQWQRYQVLISHTKTYNGNTGPMSLGEVAKDETGMWRFLPEGEHHWQVLLAKTRLNAVLHYYTKDGSWINS